MPGPLRMGPPSLALWAYLTYFDDVFAVEGTVIEKNVQWGGAETVGTVDLKRVWYGEECMPIPIRKPSVGMMESGFPL